MHVTLKQQILNRIQALEDITDDEVRLLELTAETCGNLEFSNLRELSLPVAIALSKHRGDLSFSMVQHISPVVAVALSKHQGDLAFPNLRTLCPAAALSLAAVEWNLSFNRLSFLSEETSTALSKAPGFLSLTGVTSPNKVGRAFFSQECRSAGIAWGFRALAEDEFCLVRGSVGRVNVPFIIDHLAALPNLTSSPQHLGLVRNASLHWGEISLPLLKEIPVEIAQLFTSHRGKLCLDGLITLQQETAEALSNHQGWALSLNGLGNLSDACALALGRHTGDLHLDGLVSLTVAAAEGLARHPGGCNLSMRGLTSLSDDGARALAEHPGELSLQNLRFVSSGPGHLALRAKLGL